MPGNQDDPAAALLSKIGRVLRVVGVVAVVIAQVPLLTSGKLINVVAGLLNIGFMVWLMFRATYVVWRVEDRTNADDWRAAYRSTWKEWAGWVVAELAFFAGVAITYDITDVNFGTIVIPALGLLMTLYTYLRADKIAARHAEHLEKYGSLP